MKNIIKKYVISGLILLASSFSMAQMNADEQGPNVNAVLILTVEKQGDVFSVISARKVNGLVISAQDKAQADGLTFLIKNREQAVLGQGHIVQPDVLRGSQQPNDEHAHDHMTLDNSVFVIKYPYQEGMAILNILKPGVQARSGVSSAPVQDVSFEHLLN